MLVEAFRKADKNGDGRLSTAEIHGIYLDHGVDVTMEEVCIKSTSKKIKLKIFKDISNVRTTLKRVLIFPTSVSYNA